MNRPNLTRALARSSAIALVVVLTGTGTAGVALAAPPAGTPADVVVEPAPTVTPTPEPLPSPTPDPPADEETQNAVEVTEQDAAPASAADPEGPALFAAAEDDDLEPLVDAELLGAATVAPDRGPVTNAITVTTSAGCPDTSTTFIVQFAPLAITGDTVELAEGAATDPQAIRTPGARISAGADSFADAAEFLDEPLIAGNYGVGVVCLSPGEDEDDAGDDVVDGFFLARVYLTSATEYQSTPPASPSPTPTPSPTTTPAPSPMPTPSPSPSIAPVSNNTNTGGGSTTATAANTGGVLAFTGAPIGMLTTLGGGLAALGSGLVLAGRRLRRAPGRPS